MIRLTEAQATKLSGVTMTPLQRLMAAPKLGWSWKITTEQWLSIGLADRLRELTLSGHLRAVWTHIPNEGKRHPIVGAIQKRMGCIAGSPDFVFLWDSDSRPSCGFIELKTPEQYGTSQKTGKRVKTRSQGQQSPCQGYFQSWCQDQRVAYALCRTVDEALEVLKSWGMLA